MDRVFGRARAVAKCLADGPRMAETDLSQSPAPLNQVEMCRRYNHHLKASTSGLQTLELLMASRRLPCEGRTRHRRACGIATRGGDARNVKGDCGLGVKLEERRRMGGGTAKFTQADITITRALRGAIKAGFVVRRVEIDPQGKIVVVCADDEPNRDRPADLNALRKARGWPR